MNPETSYSLHSVKNGTSLKWAMVTFLCVSIGLSNLACTIVVNVSFPTEEIEDVADEIVGEVRPTDSDEETPIEESEEIDTDKNTEDAALAIPSNKSLLASYKVIDSSLLVDDDKDKEDEIVKTIKKSLKERFKKLLPYYNKLNIGENNKGLLTIKSQKGLSVKEKLELRKLFSAENKDRMNLYKRVAQLKKIPKKVEAIQKIFAKSWAKGAKVGWWIQDEKGKWAKKKKAKKKDKWA